MAIAAAEALAPLGFTGLESQIYAFLLRESPATGYRIAQGIGKAVANTYKAIESLEAKGAVVVDEESSRQCRPVPVEDLLGRMSREFEAKKASAQEALASLTSRREIDVVFTLRTRQAVLDQARDLLATAKQTVLISASSAFISDLAEAIKRFEGTEATVQILKQSLEIEAASTVGIDFQWPGDALVIAVDAEQMLQALVDRWGTVVQAIWSRSPYLSILTHQALASQACLKEIEVQLAEGAGAKRITKSLNAFLSASQAPGFQKLHDELL